MHKLGVIVPYRNRYEHLVEFKTHIVQYLKSSNIDFKIIIVEQDDAKLFNRGMILNIGAKYAKELGCDYIVFHDVDMLPIDVDYSYSNIPLHLATNFITKNGEKKREMFDQYFGGVTMITMADFEKINGYSNKYWGWGFEDDDLFLRCQEHNIKLQNSNIKNIGRNGVSLKFNGINSLVKCNNTIDYNMSSTFFISFYPDKLN